LVGSDNLALKLATKHHSYQSVCCHFFVLLRARSMTFFGPYLRLVPMWTLFQKGHTRAVEIPGPISITWGCLGALKSS